MFALVLLPAQQIFEVKERRRIMCVLTVSDARTYSTVASAPVRGCGCICRACMHGWVSATSYVPKGHLFVSCLVSKGISLF
jgi:hypothetical protein